MELTNYKKDFKKNGRPSIDMATMVYGKIPPQARELEEAILGGCMLDSRAFSKVAEILQPECFYVDAHQKIFKAFHSLAKKQLPVDLLTTVQELKAQGDLDIVGGAYAVTKLTNSVATSSNIEAHSRYIMETFLKREMIRIAGEIISDAYEDCSDVFDLIDSSEGKITSLSINKQNKPYTSLKLVAEKTVARIREIKENKEELTGVPTGLRILDLITQGWQPSNLIILAARPAVGKSAVAGNIAVAAASNPFKPTPVGVFSLEMPSEQWVMRMISSATGIEQFDIKRGRITDQQMDSIEFVGLKRFATVPIYFDDSPSLNIFQFKSKARMMVLRENVGLLIVDYLQLMGGEKGKNDIREQEVAKISRELKQLAKELQVPIIALSQVGRKGETGDLKLSDLRESGAIEQDADDVIFLIPPSEDEIKKNVELRHKILIKIAKHRNGTTTEVDAFFVKEIQKLMGESEYTTYLSNLNQLPLPGSSFRKIEQEPAKLFIQKGSKMSFDDIPLDENNEDIPF